jgi:YfiH family protein
MIDRSLIKTVFNDIRLIDLSDRLGTWAGIFIRNDHIPEDNLKNGILDNNDPRFLKKRTYSLTQKHTSRIVSSADDLNIPADGIFSQSHDDILMIKTADCIPLFIYDGNTAAVLHLGWRGIVGGIIANIKQSIPQLDIPKSKIVIGPGIRKCCFAVSPEVALIFESKYRDKREGKYYIDLEAMVIDELKKIGFEYISSLNACTYCETDIFYSFRREGNDVRHLLSYINPGGCSSL